MAVETTEGITISFCGTAIAKCTDYNLTVGGEPVECTGVDDTSAKFLTGVDNPSAKITTYTNSTALVGDIGSLVIGSTTIPNMLCTTCVCSGTVKGMKQYEVNFVPSETAGT